jgi:hypothetical protein
VRWVRFIIQYTGEGKKRKEQWNRIPAVIYFCPIGTWISSSVRVRKKYVAHKKEIDFVHYKERREKLPFEWEAIRIAHWDTSITFAQGTRKDKHRLAVKELENDFRGRDSG